jgi:hypothetical protein
MKTSLYSAIIDECYIFVGRKLCIKNGIKVWKPHKNSEITNIIKNSLLNCGLIYSSLEYRDFDEITGSVEVISITFQSNDITKFINNDEILIKLPNLYCNSDKNENATLRVIDKITYSYSNKACYLNPLDEELD